VRTVIEEQNEKRFSRKSMLDYIAFIVVQLKVTNDRMMAFLIPRNPVLRRNITNTCINLTFIGPCIVILFL